MLTTVGCSSSPEYRPPKSTPTPSSSPSATKASAFCLGLSTYEVHVVFFRAEVAKALHGNPLDMKDLRRRATMISYLAKPMKASTPPEVADDFRVVNKAVDTTAGRLKAGARVKDIVDPVYNERVKAATDALNRYECEGQAR
ncbi:hypothetical protein [Streptomyces sp. NPDC005438]|uniref:hypothetical protein n=1 Tax=Streptomyces sp. NPDC005438 TaxID=3156880 RepID=UPI0033AEBE17